MIDPSARIDPSAEVASGASVGARSEVAPRARVGHASTVGADVRIGPEARLDDGVVVGDRAIVEHGALVFRGVSIDSAVYVGPRAILTNDRYPRAITSAGDVRRAADLEVAPVRVRHGASIGAAAVVVAGVEIGRFAMVGAGAVVTRDVPPHAVVAGSPARRLGWACACGMRLVDANGDPAPAEPAHYSRDTALHCPSCGRVYTYVPDAETVEEASGPRSGIPA